MAVTKRFQVEVLRDREITEHVYRFEVDEELGTKQRVMRTATRVVPESYMVYFVGGHSIWVESKQELARLALMPANNFEIDTDTGLPIKPPDDPNIKANVLRKTQVTNGAMS
jgi:hypothetical protein